MSRGDPIVLTGREDVWDGHRWLWARAAGREGWIPDDLARDTSTGPVAGYDFDAMELTCRAGDEVELVETRNGWARVRDRAGVTGWVPCACLQR